MSILLTQELQPRPQLMVWPFPMPGPKVRLAYSDIQGLETGQTKRELAPVLPRPWVPGTCTNLELRCELWEWLDQVVAWLNHEYSWDLDGLVPSCWSAHPHIVNELAVVADQRYRTTSSLGSDSLEEWHRYTLPMFINHLRERLRGKCEEEHEDWPGRTRQHRYLAKPARESRQEAHVADLDACKDYEAQREGLPPRGPLRLVDQTTGDVIDPD